MRPKIGAVSYLNTKPLVEGMSQTADQYELHFDLPSRLADRLSAGELDVALIPVVEAAAAGSQYTIVSDACIACHGPVWSVKLMSRVPGEQIQTLALDEGSRTSCALTRVLLDKKFDTQPQCVRLSIEDDWRDTETDAVLIIGDRAMDAGDMDFPFVWDLGELWNDWTGQPFVFAVWAARAGQDLEQIASVLGLARDRGLQNLEQISSDNCVGYGLSNDDCLKYLRDYLHFSLGDAEKSGMNLFLDYASQLSLIPNLPNSKPLRFYDCQPNNQHDPSTA